MKCDAECYWNGRGKPQTCKNRCGKKPGSNPTSQDEERRVAVPVPTQNCCDDKGRKCDETCAAFAIMAIPRSRLIKDEITGMWNCVPDREPYMGCYCKKYGFPVGLNADGETIVRVEPEKKKV